MCDGQTAFEIVQLRQFICDGIFNLTLPSVLYRPRIFQDGNSYCCLLGENLQEGIAGFGDSPQSACEAFDTAWFVKLPITTPQPASEPQQDAEQEGEQEGEQ